MEAPSFIRVLDIETSGKTPQTGSIIEIGSVDLLLNGEITNLQTHQIATQNDIDAAASAIHHIIKEDLTKAVDLDTALPHYRGAPLYAAHNCEFEQLFLDKHLGAVPWVCTYRTAVRVWPDLPKHTNQFLRYHFGFSNPFGIPRNMISPHSALGDAIVTAAILAHQLKGTGLLIMQEWAKEPALYTKINFGQFDGATYADIAKADRGYLDWVIKKSRLSDSVKFSAAHALANQ